MAYPLTEFLISLIESRIFNQYSKATEQEREAMMTAAGLSADQIPPVIQEDIQKILDKVGEELYPRERHRGAKTIHLQITVELPQTDK
jgi:hypothetical protein